MLVSGYSYAPFKELPGVKVFVGPGAWVLTVGLVPGVLGLPKVHDPFALFGLHDRTVAGVVPTGKNVPLEHVPEVPLKIVQRVVGTI